MTSDVGAELRLGIASVTHCIGSAVEIRKLEALAVPRGRSLYSQSLVDSTACLYIESLWGQEGLSCLFCNGLAPSDQCSLSPALVFQVCMGSGGGSLWLSVCKEVSFHWASLLA